MSNPACSTASVLPFWVTTGFISGTWLMMIVTSWYSFQYVSKTQRKDKADSVTTLQVTESKESEEETTKTDKKKKNKSLLLKWVKDIWKRKSVYVPLITHLGDTATDFAAVIEFYLIASSSSPADCGINVWYLFFVSIGAMTFYRIISSITVWRITKSMKRVIAQFIDIELFQILWLSHRLGLTSKSSPQRLISVLEAVFEAAPQSMIQVVYLLKTQQVHGSEIILVSSILSFINLTITIIGDDKQFLEIPFDLPCDDCDDCMECIKCHEGCDEGLMKFITLYMFRICDVPSSILIYVCTWYYMSGYVTSVILAVDVVIAIICYVTTRNTDALLSVIAMPFSFAGEDDDQKILAAFYCYSFVRCVIINVLMWTTFDAAFDTAPSIMWMFTSVTSIAKYCFFGVLLTYFEVWEDKSDLTRGRNDVGELLIGLYFDDVIELTFYKKFDMQHNAKQMYESVTRNYTLLAIAARCSHNHNVFDFVWDNVGLDSFPLEKYETALMAVATERHRKQSKGRMQLILRHCDYTYIMKKSYKDQTALFHIVRRGLVNYPDGLVDVFLEGVNKILQSESDQDRKRIDLLNNMNSDGETAFIVACASKQPLPVFRSLFEFCPESYRKEALGIKIGTTTLESLCKEHELTDLLAFIKEHE